jgi:uncharacterized membrane protein YciS (DUF1049 family)
VVVTGILVSLVITMEVFKISEFHISMLLGMGLGISTSPLMIAGITSLRSRRKMNRMIKELVEMQKQQRDIAQ